MSPVNEEEFEVTQKLEEAVERKTPKNVPKLDLNKAKTNIIGGVLDEPEIVS